MLYSTRACPLQAGQGLRLVLLGGLDLAEVHHAALGHQARLLHGAQVRQVLVPARHVRGSAFDSFNVHGALNVQGSFCVKGRLSSLLSSSNIPSPEP